HTARWLGLVALVPLVACSGSVSDPDESSRMSPGSVMPSTGGSTLPPTAATPPAAPSVPSKPVMPVDAGARMPPKDAGGAVRDAGVRGEAGAASTNTGSLKLPPAGAG